MADWIYCGSDPPVGAGCTQSLLRTHSAVWCCPPGLRSWPGTPEAGERLWLLWFDGSEGPLLLLGGGRIAENNKTRFGANLLHTNTDIPGVRDEAAKLGYGGGNAMSFLRLASVVLPTIGQLLVDELGMVPTKLSKASKARAETLNGILEI